MKKINSILAGLLLTATICCTQQVNAQAPQRMSYQSVLRNSSNVLLASKQVGIRISVLQGTLSGNAVYTETQTPTTNGNGLVSLQIGTGANQTGTFAGIDWSAGPYFIKTETDPAGGTNYSITGTQEILSVPYALNGITAAQANAIVTMQAQITALQAQVASLLIPTLNIGDSYQGGIIAYILQIGDPGYDANTPHGLIAAPSDQSSEAEWGCNGTTILGADSTAIGTGNQNTIDIMNECATAGIAASICGDLVLNGYSNWYLPSRDELNILYLNKTAVGGFASVGYWSSTEIGFRYAYLQSFTNGFQLDYNKDLTAFVRAVRSF